MGSSAQKKEKKHVSGSKSQLACGFLLSIFKLKHVHKPFMFMEYFKLCPSKANT